MNPIDNNLQYTNPQQTYFAPPPRKSSNKIIVIVIIIVAIVAAAGITYVVQQGKVDSLNAKVESLSKQLDEAKKAANSTTDNTDVTPVENVVSDNDTERQTDVKAVASHLETYNAENAYYPTLANMNDSTWLSVNMKGLDRESTRDPNGTSYKFLATATDKQYGYEPTKDDGTACDNKPGNECTKFKLTYMTDDGSQESVLNL